MSRCFSGSFIALFLGAAFLLCTGCEFNGGGYILSINGADKATFAFHGVVHDDDPVPTFMGQGQYNDHGVGVKFHADLGNYAGCYGPPLDAAEQYLATAQQQQTLLAVANGTYWPQPRNLGPPGCVLVIVQDAGEPGIGQDTLEVALFGGIYDGYVNAGFILGGNIQVKEN